MKSIILNNNNYWKKTKFILAISIVVLLLLIEQVKTEGINIKVDMEDDNEKNVLSSTSVSSMDKTIETTTITETKNNETQKAEMLMDNNAEQKAEDLTLIEFRKYNEKEDLSSDGNFYMIFYGTVLAIGPFCCYCICWCILCCCPCPGYCYYYKK